MESKTRFRTAGLLILFVCAATDGQSCRLVIPQTSSNFNPPHIVKGTEIVHPQKQGTNTVIPLTQNEVVTVACEGNGNKLSESTLNQPFVTGKCVSGDLEISNRKYRYDKLGCTSKIKETLVTTTRRCGLNNQGTEVEIGWQIKPGTFVVQITVCYDARQATSYYSSHTVAGASLDAAVKCRSGCGFKTDTFFRDLSANDAYTQASQIRAFDYILGSNMGRKYISGAFYLARGHLSPNADFIDEASRRATFYYINVLPQWQAINNGNWGRLEDFVRRHAKTKNRNLHIYTGSFDMLTFPTRKRHRNGSPVHQPIFLRYNHYKIPVPKIIWKVIHDPVDNRAAAFVSVNNPHLTAMTPDYEICNDVCNQMSSVTNVWVNRLDFKRGYMYCCSVADLRKKIPYAPANLDRLPLLQ